MTGEANLQLRILAAAVFGSSPSAAALRGDSGVCTPFEYGSEQLVGPRPADPGEPALSLTQAEYNELWGQLWSDGSLPREDVLFVGPTAKDTIFEMTAGQVRSSRGPSPLVARQLEASPRSG